VARTKLKAMDEEDKKRRLKDMQTELQAAIDAGDEELAADISRDIKRAKLEMEAEKRDKEIKKQAAIQERKNAIFERAVSIAGIVADTAKGIMKAVAASPITLGMPWAGLIGAAGAFQVGTILAEPLPQIPSYAKGGISSGGLALVGEQGAELLNLPRGTQIFNNQETNEILERNMSFSGATFELPNVTDPESFLEALNDIGEDMGRDLLRR